MTLTDHPLRYALANELHARPFPVISAPASAVYLALKRPETADKTADRAHLIALLDRYGAPHPQPDATHYSGQLGRHHLKWEQHTEFVTYTVFQEGLSARAFDPTDVEVFPNDWLAQAPGVRIASILIRVETDTDTAEIRRKLGQWFVQESLAVSHVLDRAGVIAGDFRIDPAGHSRFAVFVAPDTGARRVGRVVQRLCEIETYKAMSMLGLARARDLAPDLAAAEAHVGDLMIELRADKGEDAARLDMLLATSAELEDMRAQSTFRFGATKAYEAIVLQRIKALREDRFDGRQTFSEFMMRRYDPAMRTVQSTEARLLDLADRALRVGQLMRTQVDVARSAQNQELLESMDRRADLALRLQETVEGLSVVAISYYAVSLAGYLFYPLTSVLGLSKGELTALLTLPVIAGVWWAVRRIKARLH